MAPPMPMPMPMPPSKPFGPNGEPDWPKTEPDGPNKSAVPRRPWVGPTLATATPRAKQAAAACEEQTSRRWRTVKLVFPRARPHESDDEAAARALGA